MPEPYAPQLVPLEGEGQEPTAETPSVESPQKVATARAAEGPQKVATGRAAEGPQKEAVALDTEKPIDTISGVTKEMFEARSAGTPEAAKNEKIIGAIAIGIAILVIIFFALNS